MSATHTKIESALVAQGVFKGAHGLEGLANASDFWERQPYGTRFYYGDGIADYLHIGVLRAAIKALAAAKGDVVESPAPKINQSNRASVDCGALQLALNVLRRAGKNEVADALMQTVLREDTKAAREQARGGE